MKDKFNFASEYLQIFLTEMQKITPHVTIKIMFSFPHTFNKKRMLMSNLEFILSCYFMHYTAMWSKHNI